MRHRHWICHLAALVSYPPKARSGRWVRSRPSAQVESLSPPREPGERPAFSDRFAVMGLLLLLVAAILSPALATEDPRLKVQVTTWNVKQKSPPDDVTPILGLEKDPDIVAIGLQEVMVSPHEAILNAIFIDKWTKSIDNTIQPRGYTKIRTVSMVGIILNVYVRNSLYSRVNIIDHARVRTGFKGLWGNKGGVALSFQIYASPITFVAAHLTHADHKLERRVDDYNVIEKRRGRSCSQEDYTFWLGDFNFRLNDPDVYTADRIQYMVQKGQLTELLEKDQLNDVKGQGRVFKGYEEQPISFKPTYRYYVGTNTYDLARRPAWTDRVLYRAAQGREITPLHYGSISQLDLSDHKPVEAFFHISVAI